MMKQKKHRKIPALAAGTTLVAAMPLMASCSTDYHSLSLIHISEPTRPY